ncbi:hypothetical protein JCM19237_6182 [Photobacterium aphoticum]|uniref:Uncharacterized protein n=1 Tax=Photobacterium aphoticum TaxID=754436 RepID=A0A090QN91_9GAMM|nr:hypothetical protein JCM19237_6182 [Photobacterium aphoticum]
MSTCQANGAYFILIFHEVNAIFDQIAVYFYFVIVFCFNSMV